MITTADIPELVEDVRTGELREEDAYALCLELFVTADIDDVISQLPHALRQTFTERLRSDFDNDTPPDDYVWFDSGRGEHPAKRSIIERVRAWLKDPRTPTRAPT